MSSRSGGAHGGPYHRELVNWLGSTFITELRESFYWIAWALPLDQAFCATMLGTLGKGDRSGGYYPDGVLLWSDGETGGAFAIEVGRYEPDRTPRNIPVIHIGFGGKVSLIDIPRSQIYIADIIQNLFYVITDPDDFGLCRLPNFCSASYKETMHVIGIEPEGQQAMPSDRAEGNE